MTPAQLALASGAEQKWIQNTRRLLGRPGGRVHGPDEARWFGLVHELHGTLGCSLAVAARVADAALAAPAGQRELRVPLGDAEGEGRAELVIDLWRDQSVHLARLSRALVRRPPERRGRPRAARPSRGSARTRAARYGIDVARLRAGLSRTAAERLARLDENVAFLAEGRAALAHRRAGA
jgi:hypothetical protein